MAMGPRGNATNTTKTRPTPPELRPWLIEQARRAGEAVMAVYAQAFEVEAKADASPLTEADMASHQLLRDALAARAAHWPVVSEEDGAGPDGAPPEPTGDTFWLVDPLDGTKEFVKRNGEFTVNVAMIESGRPVLGVVHAPALDVTYSAAEGEGAFRDDGDGERPIRTRGPDGNRIAVVASRSHGNPATDAFIETLASRYEVSRTSIGSSLKLCYVADGTAQYYPRLAPTMAWDTAAAHAVVAQAGGEVVDARRREPLRYAPTAEAGWRNPSFIVLYAPDAWVPEETSP